MPFFLSEIRNLSSVSDTMALILTELRALERLSSYRVTKHKEECSAPSQMASIAFLLSGLKSAA